MEYIFFYASIVVLTIVLFFCISVKKILLSNIIIAIATVGFSLINDSLFGSFFKLFHYINPEKSTLYIILAAIFIYPSLNIIYTMFLPDNPRSSISYTLFWIVGLLFFEYLSVVTKSIVFTGWQPIPWSIVLYIVSYLWIYNFYKYLIRRELYEIK